MGSQSCHRENRLDMVLLVDNNHALERAADPRFIILSEEKWKTLP